MFRSDLALNVIGVSVCISIALARLYALTVLHLDSLRFTPILPTASLLATLCHDGPDGEQEHENANDGHYEFLGQKRFL